MSSQLQDWWMILPQGIGEPVEYRSVPEGFVPTVGFITDEDPDGKVLAEDGVSLRDLTPDELVLRERQAALKNLRDRIQYGGFEWPVDSGTWFQSDAASQAKIMGRSQAAASLRVSYPCYFITEDNVPYAFADIDSVLDWSATLHEHVSQCYENATVLSMQLAESSSPDSISFAAGWPKTRIPLT